MLTPFHSITSKAAAFIMFLFLPTNSWCADGQETETIFAGFKDYVVQIQMVDQGSPSKSNIGSGFIMGSAGHVITNYHVISELINRPGRFRAEYIRDDETKGELHLVHLDVVHDLAIMKADELKGHGLSIEKNEPAKGERLYAFGNPFDLGLTIVEGTYNGLLEKSLYEKIHFTGSLNPGMSGGPTLNRKGRVVGVNVSTAGNQVSFLVPARYILALQKETFSIENPHKPAKLVRDQLLANQEHTMAILLAKPFPLIEMGGFRLPGELNKFVNCWGGTNPNEDNLYDLSYQDCATSDDIFLANSFSSGIIHYRHELFTSKKAGPLRFYDFLEDHFQTSHIYLNGEERQVTNYQCSTDIIKHGDLQSKVVFCMREYKKFQGLYDAFLSATTLESGDQALHTTLAISGVSFENALRFSQTYIESISAGEVDQ